MKNKTRKIIILFIFLLWYMLSVIYITPFFLQYFFESDTILAELLAELISVGFPVCMIAIIKNRKTNELLFTIYKHKIYNKKIWIAVMGGGISLFFVGQYFMYLVKLINIAYTDNIDGVYLQPDLNLVSFLLGVMVFIILPAIYEEIMFRGLFGDAFKNNKILLYIFSALVFAICHGDIRKMVYTFILGLFLMWLYQKYCSIKLVVIIHLVSNFLSFICSYIVILPYSPLHVLMSYANEKQIKVAIAMNVLIIFAMIIINVWCIRFLESQYDIPPQ